MTETTSSAVTGSALEPFRIAIEVRTLHRGGLESVVAQLVRGLPREGIDAMVVCTERGGETADRIRREGFRVEVLTGDDRDAELAVLLQRSGVQLLNPHFSMLGTPVAARLGIPVVATLHNAYAWVGNALWDEFRTADEHVSCYIAVSESVARYCSRRFAIDRDRIAVVRNGVARAAARPDAAARAAARNELRVGSGAEVVLQVGAISRVKSQLALVDAMAALVGARPRLVAYLAGPDLESDYAQIVRDRIAAAGLEERVCVLGKRDDVPRLLLAADVMALPSVIEGLSLAAIEALAAGVPVVATRTGDVEAILGENADIAPLEGPLPGALIDGPEVDPWEMDGERLRELAGAEHPVHGPALARALADVLDDLASRRAAAEQRGAAIAAVLSPETVVRGAASVLLRCAATHASRRAAELERQRAALERELAAAADLVRREERIAAEIARLDQVVGEGFSGVGRRLDGASADVRQVLDLSRRTLDKLRITWRVKQGWRALAARVRSTARTGAAASPRSVPVDASSRRIASGGREGRGGRREHWLILAVVPIDDIGGAQRSAQLARALAAAGCRVTYAARFPRSESVDLDLGATFAGIEVVAWSEGELCAWLRSRDEKVRVLVEAPDEEAARIAAFARTQGARVVYDKIDAWEACSWATWATPEAERHLVALADDLVASARSLQRDLGSSGRTVHLVPNAVDETLFSPARAGSDTGSAPPDMARGELSLVYAGSLWGEWFDWEMIRGIATMRPSWRVNLVGDPPRETPVALPENVRFVGLKPQADLPAYYAAADACLVPFRPGPVVTAVNPLKVYEYLAMRRPVIATAMPELRDMPHVYFADDAAAAVAAVERATTTTPPLAEIDAFVAANTWRARVRALRAIAEVPTVTVIVLCYNNADVVGRCVETLYEYRGGSLQEIVVVDNGSTDGSLEILAGHERAGRIRLLRNATNGCSSGRNLGIRETASEIVVFVDSDQWATGPGWFDPALAILRDHREIGAVAWNAGWFDPGRGRGPIVDYLPERGMSGAGGATGYRTDVAYLATSGFVVPRAVLAMTTGFDEAYDPTCFEDTDLSFQVKAAGYEIAYCPAIGLGHRPHQTTGSLDGYDGYLHRNERYFLEKWRSRPEFFLALPREESNPSAP